MCSAQGKGGGGKRVIYKRLLGGEGGQVRPCPDWLSHCVVR